MDDAALSFIQDELEYLWSELEAEERVSRSRNPDVPSMAMEGIMERIKHATELVGPVDWMKISIPFIYYGRYRHWAGYMGIDYTYPTDGEYEHYIVRLFKERYEGV